MKENKNKGISLIVLVITVVVIIILAGLVILSLIDDNPINVANKAVFLSDVKNFQTELDLYKTKQFTDKLGQYIPTSLQADETSVIYDGNIIEGLTVNDIIPSLGNVTKYDGQFIVKDGQLFYQGADVNKQDWAIEAGVEVLIIGEPRVTIIPPLETVVEQGTNIVYTIKFLSNVAITTVNLEGNIEILDSNEIVLPVQPLITIGTISGTSIDTTRQVDITISTNNILNGSYKLKVKAGVVTNENNLTNTQDTISLIGFDIADTTFPVNPSMSVDVTDWTNENVLVTIIYSEDSAVKEYSLDAVTWNIYTSPVSVTQNNTTVYARGKNLAGNESGVSTLTVANIDKILPTITATNGGTTTSSVTVTAVASDTGGSGINVASYQYSKDNGATWTSATNVTSNTFTGLLTGTYECKVKVMDEAGNITISNSVAITTVELAEITMSSSPAIWTNENVTVTVTYSSEVVTKQYSLNGTVWNTYIDPIVVSTNNTTVYAKGLDIVGNQSTQATLTVANIDKTIPTLEFGTNGAVNAVQASTTITASDIGSGINVSTLQYVLDTQNVTVPITGWTTFVNGTSITIAQEGISYIWVKASDNVGNILITKSNSFTIGEPITIVSTMQTLNKTFSGATSGFSYDNPVIPAGFVALNTLDASWNNLSTDWDKGLVIQDANANKFVWVPVDGTNVIYQKWCTTNISYTSTTDDTLPLGFNESSITEKYKGFYIARYESMFDYNGENIRVASKKSGNKTTINWAATRNSTYNNYLWNFISYTEAKAYSENMADSYGYNTSKVGTNLVTGTQWDTVLKWIQNSGKNVAGDSGAWANYINSVSPASIPGFGSLQISGYSNNWKAKNIYDIAGNLWEWTNELYNTDAVARGGSYTNYSNGCPASFRDNIPTVGSDYRVGFRTALYITAPANPVITASPTGFTNGDVIVTITYQSDAVLKEYSTDGTVWNNYTSPITVSIKNTTIYAKVTDSEGNQSSQSTLTVSNIDRTIPVVSFGTNGGINEINASTSVTASDTESGINTSTLQYVWDTQNVTTPIGGWTTFTNGSTITRSEEGIYYLWVKVSDNAGNILITKSNSFTIGELITIVSTMQTSNKTFSGATTGFSYNNPVIPAGFVAVNTIDANWNNLSTDWNKGLVIQDASYNKFVWVPVDGTNVIYQKWCTTNRSYTSTTDDTLPSGFSESNITTKYKGFYIARYESMFDYNGGNIRVASKKSGNKTTNNWAATRNATYNSYLWNCVSYTEAKAYAENMAISYGYNTLKVGTNLVTGTQWDTVLKWIQNSGKNVAGDSGAWGNYYNSVSPANITGYRNLQVSGFSSNWKAQNIYDIAGNLWEWTNELYNTDAVARGGAYTNYSNGCPASFRDNIPVTGNDYRVGFRTALYITAPANPVITPSTTSWTNGDVTVTITYPIEAVLKQYSTNGTLWNNYTSAITFSTNGTIYAKALDSDGNQISQSSITITNIDKTLPTVSYGTNGGIHSIQVSTTVTASDLGSGINASYLQYLWDTQNVTTPINGWTTFANGTSITKGGEGVFYLWIKAIDNAGNSLITKSNSFKIGEGTIVSILQTVNKTFSGATSGFSYNNPVIPAGFVALNTSDSSWNSLSTDWNKGLVIQDSFGNQFVWVPVDGTNVTYAKWLTVGTEFGGLAYTSTTDDTLPSGFNVSNITTKYKGFYIARYEPLFDYNGGSIRAAIRKSSYKATVSWSRDSAHTSYLWNFINYTDSKIYAESMATSYGYDISKVGTNLVTGAQWDTTMKWIQNSGISITDSRTWGNHSDSISPANIIGFGNIQTSGYGSYWKSKNIYDLAGNAWEWTNEVYSSNRVCRSGGRFNSGSNFPASYRHGDVTTLAHDFLSFRVALYIL